MKYVNYLTIAFLSILISSCNNNKDKKINDKTVSSFSLQKGDLLFQANVVSEKVKAIQGAGEGYKGLKFSHVGILDINYKDTLVIEATTGGVRCVKLEKFFEDSEYINGKPFVYVGRLKPQYSDIIPYSIERAKEKIGLPYDSVFLPNNNAYYCTELVHDCYLDKENKPIFESKPMSFKDRTDKFYDVWVKFYSKVGIPVPEGVEGTNPNDMSNSKSINIVYSYIK